jgi:hypothetical protein
MPLPSIEIITAEDVLTAPLAVLMAMTPGQKRHCANRLDHEHFPRVSIYRAAAINIENTDLNKIPFAATNDMWLQCIKSTAFKDMLANDRWYIVTRGTSFSGVVRSVDAFNRYNTCLGGEAPYPGKKSFATKSDAHFHWLVACYDGMCKTVSFEGQRLIHESLWPRYAYAKKTLVHGEEL